MTSDAFDARNAEWICLQHSVTLERFGSIVGIGPDPHKVDSDSPCDVGPHLVCQAAELKWMLPPRASGRTPVFASSWKSGGLDSRHL